MYLIGTLRLIRVCNLLAWAVITSSFNKFPWFFSSLPSCFLFSIFLPNFIQDSSINNQKCDEKYKEKRLKNSIKIKFILFKSGIYPHSTYFSKGHHIAILRYHSILDGEKNDYASPNIALPVDVFDQQIQYFSKKYNIISMDEVADCLRSRRPFPERAVVITLWPRIMGYSLCFYEIILSWRFTA